MACMLPKAMMVATRSRRDEIYVAAVALRATNGPPQLAMSLAYSLNLWDLQHFMVIIKSNSQPQQEVLVYDFQPQHPERLQTALAVLSGRSVPGVVKARKVKKLPRTKCWFVGVSQEDDAAEVANKFNHAWDTNLRTGNHDCRHYTNGLVELLVGEKNVLERLRTSATSPVD